MCVFTFLVFIYFTTDQVAVWVFYFIIIIIMKIISSKKQKLISSLHTGCFFLLLNSSRLDVFISIVFSFQKVLKVVHQFWVHFITHDFIFWCVFHNYLRHCTILYLVCFVLNRTIVLLMPLHSNTFDASRLTPVVMLVWPKDAKCFLLYLTWHLVCVCVCTLNEICHYTNPTILFSTEWLFWKNDLNLISFPL